MRTKKICIILLTVFIYSSCAPPLRKFVPPDSVFRQEETLCITLKDGTERKIKFLKIDGNGIHGYFDRYYAFEEIAFIEREKSNPANIGLMVVGGVAVIAVYGIYRLFRLPDEVRDKFRSNEG